MGWGTTVGSCWGVTYFTPRRDAPLPAMPHIKSRPDYSGAWDLEFMQDISGKGASRLGVEYVIIFGHVIAHGLFY